MEGASVTSPARPGALPDAWIGRIFGRFEDFYGARFLDAWRGTDLARVKATWAEKLAGFSDQPERIGFALNALEHHPFPPTLPEFLALCRQAPPPNRPALPEPKIAPEVAAARAKQAQEQAVTAIRNPPGHAWAVRVLADIAAGVCLPAITERYAIEALVELGLIEKVPAEYVALDRAAWRAAMAERKAV